MEALGAAGPALSLPQAGIARPQPVGKTARCDQVLRFMGTLGGSKSPPHPGERPYAVTRDASRVSQSRLIK